MAQDLEARIKELEAKIQELNDREAIRDLRYRYHEYVNEGKMAEIANLFTDDGVLDFGHLGKATGRDAILQKSTYPALLGVEGARRRAQSLVDVALEGLAERGLLTQELSQVANFMVTRTS